MDVISSAIIPQITVRTYFQLQQSQRDPSALGQYVFNPGVVQSVHILGQYVYTGTFSHRRNCSLQHTGTSTWGHPTILAAWFPNPLPVVTVQFLS